MAEQYAGNERHMLNEVDRARQELTAAKKTQQDQERKAETRFQEQLTRIEQFEKDILGLHAQLQSAQNTAALAQERAADLKSLLEAQQRLALQDGSGLAQPIRRTTLAAARRSINKTRGRTLR